MSEQWRNLWLTFLRAGRYADATDAFVRWARGTGRNTDDALEFGKLLEQYPLTGQMVDLPPDLLSSLKIGTENLGQAYAAVGDAESALAELRIALDERAGSRSVLSMKINPLYDFIRDDPRFIEMMKEVNLTPRTSSPN